jgi:hypothetical protein
VPRGRQPEGEHPLSNAERQARYRQRLQARQATPRIRYHRPIDAHSGDLERSFRSIMNTDSGDHEHPHEPARAGAGERCAVMLVRHH